ncbi:MAG: hypothetical protein HQ574_07845 [Chloroflexi bacterium]|nr:hypothetical protein [Chloroflexota bacterium]
MNTEITNDKIYKRKISPLEQMFLHAPYSAVTMVARIKGSVTENMLQAAVAKVQQRHTNLRVKIEIDNSQVAWFTSQDVKEIPIKIVPRESNEHWIQIFDEQNQIPFDFDQRPGIRLILIQSPTVSELVIFCHHILCDGLSLAYLARDLMTHLGDPTHQVEILPDPQPIDKKNLPLGISINSLVNYFVERINKKWREERITFDQDDYLALSEAYWANFHHQINLVELSEEQTTSLVERCKIEKVTVNSALAVALAAAQITIQGNLPHQSDITVAGNLRDRLEKPVGEGMGFFVGAVSLKYKYKDKIGFWENVRKFNQKIQPLYTNKNLFQDPLVWSYLESGIMGSLSFKMIGGLVSRDSARFEKLASFSKRDDVISSMLKREKMDSLINILIGTAVTNLTRMDFPRHYGDLELDRLIMNPGGAYPLVLVNLVLGAVTCSGKLSLVLEYAEERIDTNTVVKIRDQALELLQVK